MREESITAGPRVDVSTPRRPYPSFLTPPPLGFPIRDLHPAFWLVWSTFPSALDMPSDHFVHHFIKKILSGSCSPGGSCRRRERNERWQSQFEHDHYTTTEK